MTGPINRVVVTLDAASENLAAIDTGVRFAARARAPLHGVFVEDEDVLSLPNLPVARQITLGAGAQPFTGEAIELHLRAEAERARDELFAAARRHRVKCTFEIVRGASAAALAGSSERDLVVAGALTRPIAGHFHLDCRWWSSIESASGPLLLARHAWSAVGGVVMLLRDRGAAGIRLLDTAAQIAEAREGVLTALCPPAVAGSEGFERWAAERLAGRQISLQVEVAPAETAALHRRVRDLGCKLLATDAGMAEGGARHLRELVEGLLCDVLIVR
jgi:hypothetical protein